MMLCRIKCLAHDPRLLKEDTWKVASDDAWNGKLTVPNPLWKSGRPDLTHDIGEFAPSTAKESAWSMNLLQAHVALAPVSSAYTNLLPTMLTYHLDRLCPVDQRDRTHGRACAIPFTLSTQ
jgi:hypothetical protein